MNNNIRFSEKEMRIILDAAEYALESAKDESVLFDQRDLQNMRNVIDKIRKKLELD